MKNIDRLYFDKRFKSLLVDIDEMNFLNLSKGNTPRIKLFIFAAALGLISPSKIDTKESMILESSLNLEHQTIFHAINMHENDNEMPLEEQLKKENVYNFIQKCANTGFDQISDKLKNENNEKVKLEFITNMNNLYEKNVSSEYM